jgi:hypothetical protein
VTLPALMPHRSEAPAADRAPDWQTHPLRWCHWYMRTNGHLYVAFRAEVDARLRRYPEARISADAVMHYLRWATPLNARGDLYKINSNAAPLFARVYLAERPQHVERMSLRRSILDDLSATELHAMAHAAWRAAQEGTA